MKGRRDLQALASRLKRYFDTWAVFEPHEIRFECHPSGFFLFGLGLGDEDYHIASRYHLTPREWTIVSGFPTFEDFPGCRPGRAMPIAEWVSTILERESHSFLYEHLGASGGGWSLARVDLEKGTVASFGSPSVMGGVHYIDNADFFAVGNKPSMLAALQSGGPFSSLDKSFLLFPVALASSIVGYRSLWNQVTRVSAGDYVTFEKRLFLPSKTRTRTFINSPYLRSPLSSADEDALLTKGTEKLVKGMSWLFDCGFPITADLTGGKDSRLILALLLGSGLIDKVSSIQTRGAPDNGDRIVAGKLAEHLDLANFEAIGAHASALDPTFENHLPRFTEIVQHYDYICSPWDAELPDEFLSYRPRFRFIGHCGELYRQIACPRSLGFEYTKEDFTNWPTRFNELELITQETARGMIDEIGSIYERHREQGTLDTGGRCLSTNQNSNWDNSRGINNLQRFTPLASYDLIKIANSRSNIAESIHYRLMRRFAPQVLKIPFLNQGWYRRDREAAIKDGNHPEPYLVSKTKQAAWQLKVFEKEGGKIIGELLENVGIWDDRVSKRQLEKLYANSASSTLPRTGVLRLYTLYAGTVLLAGRGHGRPWRTFRRFPDIARERSFAGSSVETIRAWG